MLREPGWKNNDTVKTEAKKVVKKAETVVKKEPVEKPVKEAKAEPKAEQKKTPVKRKAPKQAR